MALDLLAALNALNSTAATQEALRTLLARRLG